MARLLVGLAGAALLAYAVGLVMTADQFPAAGLEQAEPRLIVLFVVATLAVSLLHVGACVVGHRAPPKLLFVLLIAAAARLILLFGAPAAVLEGDPERLRFDARMVNQGLNPYEFKPEQLLDEQPEGQPLTGPQLLRLTRARAAMTASADAPRPEQVLRPDLRSTATPLALWVGSLADRLKPQSTRGFAFALLVADALAIFFLILALRSFRLPLSWVMVYAWCPVLLKEAYCSLAMETLVLAALALLVYCIASGRKLFTAVPVALAAALRFPLLFLAPIFARRMGALGLILVVLILAGPYLPFHTPDVPPTRALEGQIHVWRHYEYNSVLENPLREVLRVVPARAENSLTIAGVELLRPGEKLDALLAKVLCAVLLLGVATYRMIRFGPELDLGVEERSESLKDLFILLVALLAVSPVLQPWHVLWLLPVLVIRPTGLAWLTLPGLVTVSYLTHLAGPQAADYTLLGGKLSIRAVWLAAFGLLVGLDLLVARKLFPGRERTASTDVRIGEEVDFLPVEPAPEEQPTYV